MAKKKTEMDELTFEDALNRLRELAEKLESEELDLENALQGYEDAVRLASRCLELLKDAEERVKMIAESEGAKTILEDFDTDISE
ncbi:exodeoxyribonuclease VII small subunit [bacterium]|nr:exodeoxyribonuclease VII small subunit [bacterium]